MMIFGNIENNILIFSLFQKMHTIFFLWCHTIIIEKINCWNWSCNTREVLKITFKKHILYPYDLVFVLFLPSYISS